MNEIKVIKPKICESKFSDASIHTTQISGDSMKNFCSQLRLCLHFFVYILSIN